MPTIITGARLLDFFANRVDTVADVLIEGDRVTAIGSIDDMADVESAVIIHAQGKVLAPGFVDLHVHMREPGRTHKETILTGCRAAAAGGFTAVCAMPNTSPSVDSLEMVRDAYHRAAAAPVRYYPIAAVTIGQKGSELTRHHKLQAAGAVALSDDGEPIMDAAMFYAALQATREHGLHVISHCEDKTLARGGAMHEGTRSRELGIRGIPSAAEDAAVARDIALARATGGKLHIAHVSTAGSMLLIKQAKDSGLDISCEVTPHHLILTDESVLPHDANTKMNPPLRTRADVEALRKALREGYIDCIATDHAPHHVDEKRLPYAEAPFGIVGLETAFPLLYTYLVKTGELALEQLLALLSSRPAQILGLNVGALVPGGLADLVLLDLEEARTVDPTQFISLGKNTPFAGHKLQGWPTLTMVGGNIVMKDGVVFD